MSEVDTAPMGFRTMRMAMPTYDRLTVIKLERERELGRQVSFTEVVTMLLDAWAELQP